MRVSRIYYKGQLDNHELITLPLEISHYIIHVLRLKIGSHIILFNGCGGEFQATIVNLQKKEVTTRIGEFIQRDVESPLKLHLAQAISRSEKMDLTIQKAVELGVATITPLITDYCVTKLNKERTAKRLLHWHRIIISACEQSGRNIIPILNPVSSYLSFITNIKTNLKVFCDPTAQQSFSSLKYRDDMLILIGPEGGLSHQEINMALQNNFVGISLGPRILRTETAAIAAISIIQSYWGDLK